MENPSNYEKLNFEKIKLFLLASTIYLYFVGFIYTYYFYSFFGISMSLVDIPFYANLIFAYAVIEKQVLQVSVIFTGFLICEVIYEKFPKIITFIFILLIPLSFFWLFSISKKIGLDDAKSKIESKDYVHFVFTPNFENKNPFLKDANLIKISQSKDRYFVAYRDHFGKVEIYELWAKDVKYSIHDLNENP